MLGGCFPSFPSVRNIPQLSGDGVLGDDRIHVTVDAENKQLGGMAVGAVGAVGTVEPRKTGSIIMFPFWPLSARGILRVHTHVYLKTIVRFLGIRSEGAEKMRSNDLFVLLMFFKCIFQTIG